MPPQVDPIARVRDLDIALFDAISSQTGPDDRKSLLAVQSAVADAGDVSTYLETGSHLGGSIQARLVDPRCRTIYSIDKRPLIQPYDRGQNCAIPDNSSARMMINLRALS